jgi:hypothetical protein
VADVELRGPLANHELHVALDEADLLAVFPMKGERAARLIGTVKKEAEALSSLGWNDVSRRALEQLPMQVERVNWFSTYRVHHRVAEHFRRRRAFLVGDAAHVHSPVGGQGMNTGIGDAVNLAWKLATVLRGRASERILDSYEIERAAFARRLVATTDRAFTFVTRDGFLARRVRLDAVPVVLPALLARESFRRFLFRTVSQTRIDYRHCDLNAGKAGSVHGGDRLPWTDDNFAPLASLDWQVHVYGEASSPLARACAERTLPLRRFRFDPRAAAVGLAPNAAYLVRPDGYVGFAGESADDLQRYLDERELRAS